MSIFSRGNFEPRTAEIAAIEAPLAKEPFLPDNLDIIVFYGAHGDKKEFRPLKPHLEHTDVFIPEFPNWTPEEVKLYSRISQGDRKARSELERAVGGEFNPFVAAEVKSLMGTDIFVTPIDYSTSHLGADKILDHFTGWGLLDKLVPSFEKSLDAIDRFAREEGKLEDRRENIMLRSIGPRLQALTEGAPELNVEDKIRVLIQLGTSHTYFYHELVKLVATNPTCTVSRIFGEPKPIVFNHFDRLERSYRAGIELTKPERRELALRALARVGLRFFNSGGIPLVRYPSESILRPVPPDEMADRIEEDTIRDFHRRVVESKKRKISTKG